MQLVNPLNKHHWSIVFFAVLEHRAHLTNKPIKVKYDIFGGKACEDCVFYLLIDFFCEFFDLVIWTANESDNIIEDCIKLAALKHFLAIALRDIKNGIASCD